jgi:hypoxanthine-guanine phosphoribosyltransferase
MGRRELPSGYDLEFWENPVGVEIPGDNLRFLYVTDQAGSCLVGKLAKELRLVQERRLDEGNPINKVVMITMGALFPGVLLHDYMAHLPVNGYGEMEFGTMRVKYYKGPGVPLDKPRISYPLTVDVRDQVVAIGEDLVDLGGTTKFVTKILVDKGAKEVVMVAPFVKSAAPDLGMEVVSVSRVPKDTWIITPRERVETMVKRMPYWIDKGANLEDCVENLLQIGYDPVWLLEWFPQAASLIKDR